MAYHLLVVLMHMTNYINNRIKNFMDDEYTHSLFHYEIDDNPNEVKLNLAGIKKNEIQIQINRNLLKIKAESELDKSLKYNHAVRLRGNVDTDSIKAKYEDGLLTIDIENKKSKTIDIQ